MKKEEIEYLINEFGFKDYLSTIYEKLYIKTIEGFGYIKLFKLLNSSNYELMIKTEYDVITLNDNCILEDVIALLHIIR